MVTGYITVYCSCKVWVTTRTWRIAGTSAWPKMLGTFLILFKPGQVKTGCMTSSAFKLCFCQQHRERSCSTAEQHEGKTKESWPGVVCKRLANSIIIYHCASMWCDRSPIWVVYIWLRDSGVWMPPQFLHPILQCCKRSRFVHWQIYLHKCNCIVLKHNAPKRWAFAFCGVTEKAYWNCRHFRSCEGKAGKVADETAGNEQWQNNEESVYRRLRREETKRKTTEKMAR